MIGDLLCFFSATVNLLPGLVATGTNPSFRSFAIDFALFSSFSASLRCFIAFSLNRFLRKDDSVLRLLFLGPIFNG